MIKLDVSTTSVVVTCNECPFWYAFAWTREEAEASAIRHEQLVHPEDHNMRDRVVGRVTTRRARQARSVM